MGSCCSVPPHPAAASTSQGVARQEYASRTKAESEPSASSPSTRDSRSPTKSSKKSSRPDWLDQFDTRTLETYYIVEKQIGRGHYGRVYYGRARDGDQEVAIKVLDRLKSRAIRLRLEVEILLEACRGERHPSLVHLLDAFYTQTSVQLVFEYVPGGELFDLIVRGGALGELSGARMFRQLVEGVRHLHLRGIIHRDLKPENIFLTKRGDINASVKIGDFGLSRLRRDDSPVRTVAGTLAYSAPEVKILKIPYGHKSDIWSLGVMLFVLVGGYHPFDPDGICSEDQLKSNIRHGKFDFDDPAWSAVSADCKDLISRMIVVDPSRRLDTGGILQHRWMRERAPGPLSSAGRVASDENPYRCAGADIRAPKETAEVIGYSGMRVTTDPWFDPKRPGRVREYPPADPPMATPVVLTGAARGGGSVRIAFDPDEETARRSALSEGTSPRQSLATAVSRSEHRGWKRREMGMGTRASDVSATNRWSITNSPGNELRHIDPRPSTSARTKTPGIEDEDIDIPPPSPQEKPARPASNGPGHDIPHPHHLTRHHESTSGAV